MTAQSRTGEVVSSEPVAYYLPRGNGRYEPTGPLRAHGTAGRNTVDHRLPDLPM
jgi:hypothetical protein